MERGILAPAGIKAAVQSYYSHVARSAGERCCRPSCCTAGEAAVGCGIHYPPDEVAFLPAEAVQSSRGCGNPVALASLRPGEVVLDLGCGGGLDVLLAARRVGPRGFVYGLDMTDAMLELARHNAVRAGVTNVAFLKGDIEAIPLEDASVDVIISNCVINLTPDKGRAFQEAFRVLRPGGRLAVSDVVIDGDLSTLPVSEAVFRRALSWSGCLAGALTTEQYRRLLAEAGFKDIHLEVEHHLSVRETREAISDVPDDTGTDECCECRVSPSGFMPEWLEYLTGRFGSAVITAQRPVA
jgi:arsenite methyltransferase